MSKLPIIVALTIEIVATFSAGLACGYHFSKTKARLGKGFVAALLSAGLVYAIIELVLLVMRIQPNEIGWVTTIIWSTVIFSPLWVFCAVIGYVVALYQVSSKQRS